MKEELAKVRAELLCNRSSSRQFNPVSYRSTSQIEGAPSFSQLLQMSSGPKVQQPLVSHTVINLYHNNCSQQYEVSSLKNHIPAGSFYQDTVLRAESRSGGLMGTTPLSEEPTIAEDATA